MRNYKLLVNTLSFMDHITRTRVVKMGSCYARIPAQLCKKLGIAKGDEVDVFFDVDKVIYSKVKEVVHAGVVGAGDGLK
jgi:hypothetical protein